MTADLLSIENFMEQSHNELVIDVRAPIEFLKGHMPRAINIPLFDDAERAEIGTLFKQQGKDTAVKKGFELVSPKMVGFIDQVKSLSKNKKVFVYCFRGGMRSNSFGWLMTTSGLQAHVLQGGYKAYRNYVLKDFTQKRNFILLGGKTGSGKTDILHVLASHYQTINLEALANHKGSAFGSINEDRQHPQQIFENVLHQQLIACHSHLPIIMEDESQSIGQNRIPYSLWLHMKEAPIIKLEIPTELRIQKLVEDYQTIDKDLLKNAVIKIRQQLGPLNTKLCLLHIDSAQLHDVARICLMYYDKAYDFLYQNKTQTIITVTSDTMDANSNAQKVKQLIDSFPHAG